ncbi:Uncharacterized protein TPAR_04355 [Tolypocladium paradoxum]|uniref:C2H2-type domain-containing protein n=1 Tax=Tolypocladium paradoxum TaxID=94208 RepID=A0A2S4KZ50_9HYPO|nr:Uncharacterized protein TPAR_04355 [Tolypocladium paradoxum]
MGRSYDFECGTCGKTFPAGWQARENHCNATGHSEPDYECDSCPRWFNSEEAREQHMDATGHWCFECACCDDTWSTEEELIDHEHEDHLYCSDCDRFFQHFNGLQQHLNSRAHRSYQVECPYCRNGYSSAGGLTNHLESGGCPDAPRLGRDQIYELVRSKDPNGLISKNLIGWTGSYRYEATEKTWNGYAYECYLCHRTFRLLSALNQHLESPMHQQPLYHCPNRRCRMDFKSLGGIINHLESEACGCTRFEVIQRTIGDYFTGNRHISF